MQRQTGFEYSVALATALTLSMIFAPKNWHYSLMNRASAKLADAKWFQKNGLVNYKSQQEKDIAEGSSYAFDERH